MGSRFASCRFIFYVLLVSQCTHTNCIREITEKTWKDANKEASDLQQTAIDDDLQIFFTVDDLKVGKTISIYFPIKDPSTTPHLLTREEANSIPFSSSKLPQILDFFSFSKHSPQSKAMQYTLSQCELEPLKGETKFCATSLEFMLDSARGVFGLKTKFRVLITKYLSSHNAVLQNYTVLDVAKEIETPKMSDHHRVFEVALRSGNDGERVEAVGVCHMDTSEWDPDHAAFRVLRTRPGQSPVCHFFPADNLVWVASPALDS
ncbi:hypothetical protein CsSME_00009444 [Camellia sinensis var. sinensis]